MCTHACAQLQKPNQNGVKMRSWTAVAHHEHQRAQYDPSKEKQKCAVAKNSHAVQHNSVQRVKCHNLEGGEEGQSKGIEVMASDVHLTIIKSFRNPEQSAKPALAIRALRNIIWGSKRYILYRDLVRCRLGAPRCPFCTKSSLCIL